MKDYFEALAARIIRPERGVQPRPRALFEDAAALAPGASDGSAALMSASRTRSRATSAAESRDNSRRPAQRADTPGDELREADAPSLSNLRARAPERPIESGKIEREQSSDERHTARTGETAGIETATSPVVDPRPVTRSERSSGTIAPGSIEPRIVAPRAIAVAAQPSPRVAGTSQEATTVRIHIGRVDVRAIAQGATPQAPARETRRGIITLDEYVQQRGGATS